MLLLLRHASKKIGFEFIASAWLGVQINYHKEALQRGFVVWPIPFVVNGNENRVRCLTFGSHYSAKKNSTMSYIVVICSDKNNKNSI